MQVHEKIKLLRQMWGWSQEEMAHKMEMSTNGYGSIERGETDLSLSRMQQIARVLNIDVTNLFDRKTASSAQSESSLCSVCPLRGIDAEGMGILLNEAIKILGSLRNRLQ